VFNNSNSADGSIYTSQCSGASEGPRIHFLLNFFDNIASPIRPQSTKWFGWITDLNKYLLECLIVNLMAALLK